MYGHGACELATFRNVAVLCILYSVPWECCSTVYSVNGSVSVKCIECLWSVAVQCILYSVPLERCSTVYSVNGSVSVKCLECRVVLLITL